MSDLAATDELFFNRAGLGRAQVEAVVDDALGGADDGELFLEYRQSENVTIDDGKIKSAAFDTTQGFGLRAVAGESTGYAHASELSEAALKRAADTVKAVHGGGSGTIAVEPVGTNISLYPDDNPIGLVPFDRKVGLLTEMDVFLLLRMVSKILKFPSYLRR